MWGMEGVQAATPALNFLDVCCRLVGLRHTCASLLIALGASVKAVQAQLGHATASITLVRDAAIARRGTGPSTDPRTTT